MKPIHKFNNGVGATLCHQCNCIVSLGFTEDLYCKECNNHIELDEKGNPLTYWGGLKEPKQEIKLEDIFNYEKRRGVKDLIDAHKEEKLKEKFKNK